MEDQERLRFELMRKMKLIESGSTLVTIPEEREGVDYTKE